MCGRRKGGYGGVEAYGLPSWGCALTCYRLSDGGCSVVQRGQVWERMAVDGVDDGSADEGALCFG